MTQFDAQLRWLIHFHIQCDGSSMSDGGRYPAYDQSHSLQTHLWMWDVAIFPPVLCVFGEKKKLKLWWLSMTRLKAWLHHLSHETHQQRGFVGWVPSGRRWCQWTNPGACVCVFDRERAFERPVWLTLVIKVAYMVISPVSPSYALLTYLKLLPKVPSINGHTVNRSPQSTCTFPHYDLCYNMWPFPPLILFQSSSF